MGCVDCWVLLKDWVDLITEIRIVWLLAISSTEIRRFKIFDSIVPRQEISVQLDNLKPKQLLPKDFSAKFTSISGTLQSISGLIILLSQSIKIIILQSRQKEFKNHINIHSNSFKLSQINQRLIECLNSSINNLSIHPISMLGKAWNNAYSNCE